MNFILSRDELLNPLTQIVNVIEKKQTMPILANVLIRIDDSQLIMTGTDLEIQIVASLSAQSNDSLAITVPGKKLLDICRSFSNNVDIKFTLQDDRLKIQSGRSRFTLSTLSADDYPQFAEDTMDLSISLQSIQLKAALDKVSFCMGNQDVRYYLNGMMVNIFNNAIKYVASDGHRLSVFDDLIELQTGVESRFIIPRKGVVELARILDDSDELLSLQYSKNSIRVHFKNIVFSAKLVDAKYPDFSKVFVQDFNESILFNKPELKEILTRIAILSNEKSRGVTLAFNQDNLKISTHNPEQEEADEDVFVNYNGEPLNVSFNVTYLLDAISNINAEQARFTLASNGSCCIVEEPDESLYRFVVMSMKI